MSLFTISIPQSATGTCLNRGICQADAEICNRISLYLNFYRPMQKNNTKTTEILQLHPFEYLNQLNSIYTNCNRANAKSYSSVSKIKLAWKPFSLIKIPKFFQQSFQSVVKQDRGNHEDTNQNMEEGEKKIWKDHQEILKRYANKKQTAVRPRTAVLKRSKNQHQESNNIFDISDLYADKMREKGIRVEVNREDVVKEVLNKLRNIDKGQKKKMLRAQSAVKNAKRAEPKHQDQNREPQRKAPYFFNSKYQQPNQTVSVKPEQFLTYSKSSEIIKDYKAKISKVDCAISELNVHKTCQLLKDMENMIEAID